MCYTLAGALYIDRDAIHWQIRNTLTAQGRFPLTGALYIDRDAIRWQGRCTLADTLYTGRDAIRWQGRYTLTGTLYTGRDAIHWQGRYTLAAQGCYTLVGTQAKTKYGHKCQRDRHNFYDWFLEPCQPRG